MSILLDETNEANQIDVRSQDDLDYLGGWLKRSNLPIRIEVSAVPASTLEVEEVVLERPQRTATTMTKTGSYAEEQDEEEDKEWADADELFPTQEAPETDSKAPQLPPLEPLKRFSYPTVPSIDTVPASPIAPSIKSRSSPVPSVLDLPLPVPANKGKHKEIQPEPEYDYPAQPAIEEPELDAPEPPVRGHSFNNPITLLNSASTSTHPTPSGSRSTSHSNSTLVKTRHGLSHRALVSHHMALAALAASDISNPLGPMVSELGTAVEMVAEKGDLDMASALAGFAGEVRAFVEHHRPTRRVMSSAKEEELADGIFQMLLDDPAEAKEEILKLVRERNDAIAVAAALANAPTPVPESRTPSPALLQPASAEKSPVLSRSASPVEPKNGSSSRSPSPVLAAPFLPFERSTSFWTL